MKTVETVGYPPAAFITTITHAYKCAEECHKTADCFAYSFRYAGEDNFQGCRIHTNRSLTETTENWSGSYWEKPLPSGNFS